uniref:Uncharacterized protein n=1 Tax=Arundo donax TaxID=35708 RepID=A0A0A9FXG4_ARUDO
MRCLFPCKLTQLVAHIVIIIESS